MDEVQESLERAVREELAMLNSTADAAKRAEHVENVKILYQLLLEYEKERDLKFEKEHQRGLESEKSEIEAQLRLKEIKSGNLTSILDAAGEILKSLYGGITLGRIMKFEETGVFGSKAFTLWSKIIRL